MKIQNKKAAMEMSVGTIVTIVLLMTVLILGLVLVRTIFTGAKYNVDQINDKVREQINGLFSEEQALVVYLPNSKAEIRQGDEWGIAWAIKNLESGSATKDLTYAITATQIPNCGTEFTLQDATDFIILGQKEESGIPLGPGDANYEVSRIQIPNNAPLCSIRYRINTQLDNQDYKSAFFDVVIQA